ncbi:hypothetical protein [Lentzea sp. NEAU-D7]|uniref:hypothetical protein n=1 Tax=Lentzea sp. NEAU-D7 TaxID=2994667 RepID=UPI00224B1AE5|nr:hypothetical protein [Lentzea sp. NEAU-D7]MCX2954559.1 hypothetical protein [Lentzea sp. NEAU-D7]
MAILREGFFTDRDAPPPEPADEPMSAFPAYSGYLERDPELEADRLEQLSSQVNVSKAVN